MQGSKSHPGGTTPQKSLAVLGQLRQRIRRTSLFSGVVWIGFIFAIGLLASFGLDYFLRLPLAVRQLFVLAALAGSIVLFARRILAPLSRKLGDSELAMLVEEANPELNQSLLTVVELSGEESPGGRYISREMLDSVVRKVEDGAETLLSSGVLNHRRLMRNLFLFFMAAALVVGGADWQPDLAAIWFKRNLLLDGAVEWPRTIQLEIEPGTPGVIAMGDDLPVAVRVVRGAPRTIEMNWKLADGVGGRKPMEPSPQQSHDLWLEDAGEGSGSLERVLAEAGIDETLRTAALADGRGLLARGLQAGRSIELDRLLEDAGARVRTESFDRFIYVFRNMNLPLSFWAIDGSGEGRTETVEVKVMQRPRIDMKEWEEGGRNRVVYRNPPYTGKAEEEVTQRHGNLKVPVGTAVRFTLATNVVVAKVFFILKQGVEEERGAAARASGWPDPAAVSLEVRDGKQFEGRFVVQESGSYYFQFEDPEGFRSTQPERFRIQAIPDRKPMVRIVEPARMTEDVSPRAEIPILVWVKDDYSVKKIDLAGNYYAAGESEPERSRVTLLDAGVDGPRAAQSEPQLEPYVLKVADLGSGDGGPPSPGARFEYFVLAEDFGETGNKTSEGRPVGNIGESQAYLLQVVDPDYLEDQYAREVMALRDVTDRLRGRQESVRKDLEDSQEQFLLGGKMDRDAAARLSRHRQDQVRVSEGVKKLAGNLGHLLDKMEMNKVGEQQWKDWLQGLERELEDIATLKSDSIASDLDELRSLVQESDQDPAALAGVVASQLEVERDLDSIVVRMSEFGDLRGLIQLMREIKHRQEGLRDNTKSRLGVDGEGDKEE